MSPRIPKLKKGDLVIFFFEDHVASRGGVHGAIPVKAVGWFIGETKTEYHIAPWVAEEDLVSENSDSYTIRKHTGIRWQKLPLPKL